jgi:hypothetical protein
MFRTLTPTLAVAVLLGTALAAAVAPAQAQTLINLTTTGHRVADGNAHCPNQPYYLYSGGHRGSNIVPEYTYPSPNLLAFIPPGGPRMDYDGYSANSRFGDSFNLQNTRSVCYAIIEFSAVPLARDAPNDGLTIGHVQPGGTQFDVVAQLLYPGFTTARQRYALDATGLMLLSLQTGVNMDRTPADSILDVFLQDDTMIDNFNIYVWYGPNCQQTATCP